MNQQPFTESTFQSYLARHKLMASRCSACGALHLPPRPLCPDCFGDDLHWTEVSGSGKLLAFTVIHIAPTAMIEAGYGRDKPYVVAVVVLDEGPGISAQLLGVDAANPQTIAVGMPLRATFVERGEGEGQRTFLAFQPAD
ncbi:MAG: Zn-ribbon domain-containing OB-fold protein [Chloroflexota bacterium]|nr:Zn-ribbon domain-containing OB-fold protein [Chloroflexota bacterium]